MTQTPELVEKVIDRAIAILEGGWCAGKYVDEAGNHCLVGALYEASKEIVDDAGVKDVEGTLDGVYARAYNRLEVAVHEATGGRTINLTRYNDEQDSAEPVLDLLRRVRADQA